MTLVFPDVDDTYLASFPAYMSEFAGMFSQTGFELADQVNHFNDYLITSQQQNDEIELSMADKNGFAGVLPVATSVPRSEARKSLMVQPLAPQKSEPELEIRTTEAKDLTGYKLNDTQVFRRPPTTTFLRKSLQDMYNKTKFVPFPKLTTIKTTIYDLEHQSKEVLEVEIEDEDDRTAKEWLTSHEAKRDANDEEYLTSPEDEYDKTTNNNVKHALERTIRELERILKSMEQRPQASRASMTSSHSSTAQPAQTIPSQNEQTSTLPVATATRAPTAQDVSSTILKSIRSPKLQSPRRVARPTRVHAEDENQPLSNAPTRKIKTEIMAARSTPPVAQGPRQTLTNWNTSAPPAMAPVAYPQHASLPFPRHPSLSAVTRGPSAAFEYLSSPSPTSSNFTDVSSYGGSPQKGSKRGRSYDDDDDEAEKGGDNKKLPKRQGRKRSKEACSKPLYCLYKGCKDARKEWKGQKERNRHLDTHWGHRYPCRRCDSWFPRNEIRNRHEIGCTGVPNGAQDIPSAWTIHWPKELTEPPEGDPLREYFERFAAQNVTEDTELESELENEVESESD